MWNVIICDMKWPLTIQENMGSWRCDELANSLVGFQDMMFMYVFGIYYVGMVLADRLELFWFLKIKPPPPLWLNRVNCSPFIHFHCFYHDIQCLRTKIKFACGCGASRQVGSISISKNKVPPLLLHRVKWSLFRHSYFFTITSNICEQK